jgi:GT2 family glycosyltransferase
MTHHSSPSRFWVVVVNYNGWDDTRRCLRSLAQQTAPAAVVLVDNASRDDRCVEFRAEFPWCHVVRSPVNGGWAGGNNAGLTFALARGAEWVVLLNNDTEVSPRLVEALAAAAAANPDFGVLGPVIHFLDDPDAVMTDGADFNRPGAPGFFPRRPVPVRPGDPAAVADVDIVNGCCLMAAAGVVNRIGLIDERFFLVHEESDFCLRARRAGFRCGVLGEPLVWHKGSVTFRRTGRRLQRYYDARNLALVLAKHYRTHRTGRRLGSAALEYVKYVYYRYCLEREAGDAVAADGVLEGLLDALALRFGPERPRRRRLLLPPLRALAEAVRRHQSRPAPSAAEETGPRALAVR